jgi:tRNA nucleotidyltransferase/poly(A) polymerase
MTMSPAQAVLGIPAAVRGVIEALDAAQHQAVLVGGCVRGLLSREPVRDYDVATDAPPAEVLALFPRAVPIGLRHGTVMVPSRAGPVDVTTYRGDGGLEDDLLHRDFTVNAVALVPREARVIDPAHGLADLAAGRLRAVGSARARLREDPLRALRAARFVATLDLEPDAELVVALEEAPAALAGVAGERLRQELAKLLLGRRADAGLALLRRTGIEAAIAPGVRADAAAVVAALPCQLELRLAGWLRGTRVASILARLRFGAARSRAVEQILALHPIEAHAGSGSPSALRRLLSRAGPERVAAAVALRRAELDAAGLAATELADFESALARAAREGALALGRGDLAVGGREVMAWLGQGPGPLVGAALRHLTDRVIEDPSRNEPEALRQELARWLRDLPRGD